ncbi:hypothetical protein MPSEU_000005000 [Mayamaea pseudoterrestris]|nr:hypothetical protein MPSEU_000005000 [Mayamaea pseudoterrestris]
MIDVQKQAAPTSDSDDDDVSFRFPRYEVSLAKPKPFLMPDPFDAEAVIEILPSAKKTKIKWQEEILVQEIEHRFALLYPDDEDDDSYEIEIVEDDGDADFYLEIVDGEVFYVFETEDDISVDDDEYDDESYDSDAEQGATGRVLQLPIHSMAAPNLQALDDTDDASAEPSVVSEGFHESMAAIKFNPDELDMEVDDEEEEELLPPEQPLVLDEPAGETTVPRPVSPAAASNDAAQFEASDTSLSLLSSEHGFEQTGAASSANLLPTIDDDEEGPTTPISEPMPHMVDRIPIQGFAMPIAPASPSGRSVASTAGTVKSILKACPESPKNPKAKKVKAKKGEKSYTKTYVRVDTFDGEHRVYAWKKPEWAADQESGGAPKLKETDKGSALRQGQNLASPITNLPALKGVGKNQSHLINADGSIDQEAVLAKLKKGNPFLTTRNLKISTKGSMIRSGKDIVKPITMATQNREEEQINKVADPTKLRSTETGKAVKQGATLALPTTAATQMKKYEFEKPSWATNGPKLRKTEKGEALKSGAKLERDIGGIKTTPDKI